VEAQVGAPTSYAAGMTGVERDAEADVDWTAAVRRERRREAQTFGLTTAAVAALLLLRFDPSDRGFVIVAAVLLLVALGAVTWWLRAQVRPGRTDRFRSLYAIHEHVDPGVGLRVPTSRRARQQASSRWVFWLPSAALVLQAANGRWDEPAVALPSAGIFLICLGAVMVRMHQLGVASRRWLDDPPVAADGGDPPRA
jgi:hypothetical protein